MKEKTKKILKGSIAVIGTSVVIATAYYQKNLKPFEDSKNPEPKQGIERKLDKKDLGTRINRNYLSSFGVRERPNNEAIKKDYFYDFTQKHSHKK